MSFEALRVRRSAVADDGNARAVSDDIGLHVTQLRNLLLAKQSTEVPHKSDNDWAVGPKVRHRYRAPPGGKQLEVSDWVHGPLYPDSSDATGPWRFGRLLGITLSPVMLKLAVGDPHKTLLGVAHLLPLPGSPGASSLDAVIERALTDAEALVASGFDGFVIENFGDAPFYPDNVPAETIASMTRVGAELRRHHSAAVIGINVLRNDARAALCVAAATGADFIRVNVHSGVAYTDQGMLSGQAHESLRLRARLNADVRIVADVGVKHATFPADFDLARAAADTAYRGLADALIVTGSATGAGTDPQALAAVRAAVPDRPLWVGSGMTRQSAAALLSLADGAIVGTAVKQNGAVRFPVDRASARAFVEAARS